MSQISKQQLSKEVYEILVNSDLNSLTRNVIKKMLEERHHCSFNDRKDEIKEAINQYLSVMEVVSNSQKSKEEKEETQNQELLQTEEKLFSDPSEGAAEDENDTTYDGYKADAELAKIVGDKLMLRKRMNKALWKYVYDHDLLDGNMIKCDTLLESLCGEKSIKKTQLYQIVKNHSSVEGKLNFKKSSRSTQTEKKPKSKPKSEKKENTVEKKETSSKSKGGFAKEFPVDQALSEFIGSSVCSRTTFAKKVWEYIKANNLQNPDNRREIVCDAKLKTVLMKDRLDMMHIAKAFAEHVKE